MKLGFKSIQEILSKHPQVLFSYLFGSFAKGKTHAASDLDIGVYVSENNEVKREALLDSIYNDLVKSKLPASLDLVDLRKLPSHVSYEIVAKGQILMCRDEKERIEFSCRVLREYFDIEYYRQRYYKKMMDRIEGGRFGHL